MENLAKDVLSQNEFNEAVLVSDMYLHDRRAVLVKFFELDSKVGIPVPTHTHYQIKYRGVVRSIDYYCKTDIKKGIRFTRNFVENASAHVVSSCELLLEKLNPNARKGIPFGPFIDQLDKAHVSKSLVRQLRDFNKTAYKRAKHDWGPPLRPEMHLFTKREAIMMYLIARKLGRKIFDEGKLDLPK